MDGAACGRSFEIGGCTEVLTRVGRAGPQRAERRQRLLREPPQNLRILNLNRPMTDFYTRIWPAKPYPPVATSDGEGLSFALFSEYAQKVELCLNGSR